VFFRLWKKLLPCQTLLPPKDANALNAVTKQAIFISPDIFKWVDLK
jgi:hypothetical protein